ncbi:hypothetical protein SLEP1_g21549 [Rubroshorea leprosula]|uniref:Thionin-like protein 2 n=1 Tax=Rubroshorea leprosula TaxID=152421 RepID=A0AAV5JH05_9ROSI|nr:hypothetical protein SLEP1_g21549 [Rubroshorea leprosula]
MEERKLSLVLVFCLVLGLLLGQSSANFKDCYESCFILCIIMLGKSALKCSVKCLKDCIKFKPPPTALDGQNQTPSEETEYFCKLSCASSLCTGFSSRQDPGDVRRKWKAVWILAQRLASGRIDC